jgi:hypothetical protein
MKHAKLAMLFIMVVTMSLKPPFKQTILSGEIVSANNERISDAYVYVISGEEETLSLKDGRFSLKTWQPLPIVLNIEHKDFQKQRVVIRAAGANIKIKLTDRREL